MARKAEPRVVVVGSGISGVAAASRLVKAGFQRVRILEATGRSGGRILTSRLGGGVAEIGASYIHGPCEENPAFCLARDYGLLDPVALIEKNQVIYCDERPPWIPNWFSSSGQRLSTEDMSPSLGMFNELMDDTLQYEHEKSTSWDSLGHFLKSETQRRAAERWAEGERIPRKLLLCGVSALLKMECFTNAAHTLDELDLPGFCIYKGLKGLDCELPGGYEGLINSLMSELPPDLVSYNRPVHCVHWMDSHNGRNDVEVECGDGERIVADHVIVTVPLGYLKKNYSTFFSPSLPEHKLQSMQKIGFGTSDKIFVEFESQWWDANCDIIHLVWQDEEEVVDHVSDVGKSWIRKLSTFTVLKHSERPTICGWIAGLEARHMETLPEEELKDSLTKLFHTFTGNPATAPKRILRSQWFLNSWSCGSYCNIAIGCTTQDLANIMEPLPAMGSHLPPLQVLFAGEATHPIYYSTVHGALLSGWREADRLISHYSRKEHE